MLQQIKRIENTTLELLFPQKCFNCAKEESLLCDDCLAQIALLDQDFNLKGNRLIVCADYQNQLISHSVHLLKYCFATAIANPLAKIMAFSAVKHDLFTPDFIIPVPLHKKRLRWRGFNQAEVLAKSFLKSFPGAKTKVKSNVLVRSQYTTPQVQVKSKESRLKNLKNVFTLNAQSKEEIKNKRILLIDDVSTTGATLFECIKTLKTAKPKEICCLTVARQS